MNAFEKSEVIKASLRKGFRDGSSKMAKRRCYGYDIASDGALVINSEEAKVVVWIFEQESWQNRCWFGAARHSLPNRQA